MEPYQRKRKKSSAWKSAEYQGGKLRVQFHDGQMYVYHVSERAYQELMDAESPGAYFHQHIRHLGERQ